MSLSLKIRELIAGDDSRISVHALRELEDDCILIGPLAAGIASCTRVEEYPDYHKGPCVLVLQWMEDKKPIHLLWGIWQEHTRPPF